MLKFLSLFVLLLSLEARENPFFPHEGERDLPLSTNAQLDKPPLKEAKLTFPSQARILQKITVEFQNLDGSIETKSIDLDNAIDWHLPLLLSQKQKEMQTASTEQKSLSSKESEDLKSVHKKGASKKVVSHPFLKLTASEKTLQLETKNEMLRHFLLSKPHRIVVDFKSDKEVADFTKKGFDKVFQEVRVGNHKGYYRIVFELDGPYKYSLKKNTSGYLLVLQ